MSASTRKSTTCPLIGPSSDLPKAELPTERQVLQKCLLVKQSSTNQRLPANEIAVEVSKELIPLWTSVHPKIPLLTYDAIRLKITTSYTDYTNLKRGRRNKKGVKASFTAKLDKLFDICSCKCKFTPHKDTCALDCEIIHIDCKCGKHKIPTEELGFMKDQREKVGPTGKYQLGPVDHFDVRKRKKADARSKSNKMVKTVEPLDIVEVIMETGDRLSSTSSEDSASHIADGTYEPDVFPSDIIDLENLAREADRYGCSDRSVAALATALLVDLGKVTKGNTSAVITRKKVRDARAKYRKKVKVLDDSPITGVYFDGKKDNTCTMRDDESGTTRYTKIKEEHYVMTSEPEGTYMTHFAPENGTAKVVSDAVVAGLDDMGATESIKVIGSDTTNTMSGTDGGAQHFVEESLDRNLQRVFCNLHTNELPFRNLFQSIDGKTSGKDSFKGPIGKACKDVKKYKVKETFTAVTVGDSVPVLSDEVMHELSWDQKCLYKLLHAVRSGKSNIDIENMQLAGLNHSRWLTLAIRLLYLCMCWHFLTPEDTENLNTLIHFIMTNYGPMWFTIKMKPLITDAPKHVFHQTKLLQLLPAHVVAVVKPFVSRNAYYAHPENLLLAMLDDEDENVRTKAVKIIKTIRAEHQPSHRPVRPFSVPKIDYDADNYHSMIDWESLQLTEPPLTYHLSNDELELLIDEALTLAPYRSHTQSVERAVKVVTDASGKVYGLVAAQGYIRSKISSRQLYKKCDTKKELIKMFV